MGHTFHFLLAQMPTNETITEFPVQFPDETRNFPVRLSLSASTSCAVTRMRLLSGFIVTAGTAASGVRREKAQYTA
jgi:hypothetical protein